MNRDFQNCRSLLDSPLDHVIEWHLLAGVNKRLVPPYDSLNPSKSRAKQEKDNPDLIGSISKKAFLSSYHQPFWKKIIGKLFIDPFLTNEIWFKKRSDRCEVVEKLNIRSRFSPLFTPFLNRLFRRELIRFLENKYELLQNDLSLFNKYPRTKPLKLLISGATGFVGRSLSAFLEDAGHAVWTLVRSAKEMSMRAVDQKGKCAEEGMEGFDGVIHLAGENISKGRWTEQKKTAILESRRLGTERLVQLLADLKNPPKTFISASGVAFYGDCGDEILTEKSAQGRQLFLTNVCRVWEKEALKLEKKGVRVVCARFGIILGAGGALEKMLIPFRFGLGGKIGSGHQYVSWIAMDDVVGALYHVLMTPSLSGPVNFTAPHPVTNGTLTRELFKRTTHFRAPPLPPFLVSLLLGQKGEELLLSSARVQPEKLLDSGYHFQFSTLKEAFDYLI